MAHLAVLLEMASLASLVVQFKIHGYTADCSGYRPV